MGLPSRLPAVPRPARDLTVAAAFGGAYLLLAEATRSVAPVDPALLWAPSGLYVGVLLLSPRRLWPLIVCAALGAAFGANLLAGLSPTLSVALAVPSGAEGFLGALVVARLCGDRFSIARVPDVAALVVGAAVVANGLTALSAAGASAQALNVSFTEAWLPWWGAHALGIVVVAPVVVALFSRSPRLPDRSDLSQAGLVAAGLAAVTFFLYSAEPLSPAAVVGGAIALPLLLFAGWRWSPRAAALATLLPVLAVTYLAPHAADPLGLGTVASAEVIVVQVFAAALAVASLAFAAAAAEGRAGQGRLARARNRLAEVVATAPDAYVSIDDAGLITDWSPRAEALLGRSRADAIGRRLHETVMPESDRAAWIAAVERRAADGDAKAEPPSRLLALHRDGRELPVELSISPATAADEPSATHLFLHDLGERERLQEGLTAADEQLAQRAAELGRIEEKARQLEQGLASKGDELDQARQDGARLETSLNGSRAEREQTEADLERARAATAVAEEQRESLRQQLAASEAAGDAARADLEAARGDRDVAAAAGERLERALDAMVMSFAEADRERTLLRRASTELIVRYDRVGVCRYASPAAVRLLGYQPAELVGTRARDLLHPDDLHHFEGAREADGDTTFAARLIARDGTPVRVEATFSPIHDAHGGHLVALEGSVRLRAAASPAPGAGRLADHDALTGLYSPERFGREVEAELATAVRYDSCGAVLVVDVDGPADGSRLLGQAADAIRGRLRETDLVGRTEAGQLAVLLPRATGSQATEVAGVLLQAVRGLGASAGASIGIATFARGRGVGAEELMVEAAIAVQEARHAGGDRAVTHDPTCERTTTLEEGLGWGDQIQAALAENRFRLYAEPVMSLVGDPSPLLCLSLRMESAGGDLVPPAVFLPAAERCGAAAEVDRRLLRDAVATLAGEGHSGRVEVSLSTRAPADAELRDFVADELRTAAVDPAGLCISIAETAAVAGTDRTTLFLRGLAALGCEVGVDRFGSGVASFLHVERLPVAYVKLDTALVERLTEAKSARLVVRSIADVARGLGIQTVAPGVSDEETLTLLRELGVDSVQGPALAPAWEVAGGQGAPRARA